MVCQGNLGNLGNLLGILARPGDLDPTGSKGMTRNSNLMGEVDGYDLITRQVT